MEVDISGKTAIITGAGRGIGEEIAHTFAEAGANVIAAARTESEIRDTVEDCKDAHGVDGLAVPTDLREIDDIEGLVEATAERFGGSEILVNNAALNLTNTPADQTLEEVNDMAEVNLRAVFWLSNLWAEQFRTLDAERGRIINISSNSAYIGVPAMTFYGATNAGVQAMTRGFAAHLAEDGVTVNSVTPGLIRNERIDELLKKQDHGEIERIHKLEEHPLGRAGHPREVAYACLFLAYDLADYINGTDITVDGGLEVTRPMYTI